MNALPRWASARALLPAAFCCTTSGTPEQDVTRAPTSRIPPEQDRGLLHAALICAGLVILTIITLLLMGRPLICTCGTVKIWHGVVESSETSQHITDWYSFTHVVHGFLFYFLAWALSRWVTPLRPLSRRLILAVLVECGWEILENTNFIIDRYREATIALNYYGDSVLNSTSDILCMTIGFLIAARLPALASLSIAVIFEAFTLWMIRDNLTLNIVMLVWPIESIRTWQAGG